MAYFLKKTRNKKGLYLQIYSSAWDPARGQTVHKSVKAVGYEHELEEAGMEDPVGHYKAVVAQMNEERKARKAAEKERRIASSTPERDLGYFPFKAVNDALGVEKDLACLQMASGFRFDLPELLSSLAYARLVSPCSKSKTFHDVLPRLGLGVGYSLDQLYKGLGFLGEEYGKVVEIYDARVKEAFGHDASTLYFDATNFYFEIDAEDGFRRKGPSKEKRSGPIVGLGLLLDAGLVPIGMKMFAGNESEKPVIRKVIGDLKRRGNVEGRTVRVADKGLNCADNVVDALVAGDGYLFSKSVRQLSEKELSWALSEEGFADVSDAQGRTLCRLKSCVDAFPYRVTGEDGRKRTVEVEEKRVVTYNPKLARKQTHEINRQVEKARRLRLSEAKKSEYGDCAKYVTFAAVDGDGCVADGAAVAATLNHDAIDRARRLAGYNMLVTSETHMSDREIYEAYHNLWRIEESFKVMKSQLDARPVYLQKQETITGHFLVCYIAVLLLRLLQFKVLDGEFSSEAIMGLARGFRVVEVSERRYVNVSRTTELLDKLEQATGLPLQNYHLTKGQVDKIMNCKLPVAPKGEQPATSRPVS